MTTGANLDPMPPELRTWAEQQLNLTPEATPADVRADLVRRLPADDFVPAWRRQQAFALLHRPGKAAADAVLRHGQLLQDEEEQLREEVSAFADVFFSLDCEERGRRWRTLRDCCKLHPALMGWLRDLEAGLAVTPVTPTNPRVVELVAHIQALFVLPRTVRGVRRRALLHEAKTAPTGWEEAANEMRRYWPAQAALEPVLIRQLARWRQGLVERQRRTAEREAAGSRSTSDSGSRGWPAWLIVAVVLGGLRAGLSGLSSSSYREPSYTPPEMPRYDPDQFRKLSNVQEEQERLRRYEQMLWPPPDGTTRQRKWAVPTDRMLWPPGSTKPPGQGTAPERVSPERP